MSVGSQEINSGRYRVVDDALVGVNFKRHLHLSWIFGNLSFASDY